MTSVSEVVGGPWFVYDADNLMRFYQTRSEARTAAENYLDDLREDACNSYWSENVLSLIWGQIYQSVIEVSPGDFGLANVTWFNEERDGIFYIYAKKFEGFPWFVFTGEDCIGLFSTRNEALDFANHIFQRFNERSVKDKDWSYDIQTILWGRVCQVTTEIPFVPDPRDIGDDEEEGMVYIDFVFVDVLDGELKCLNDPSHNCIMARTRYMISCTDCPGDLGFSWEWRSFGGVLSRIVGLSLEHDWLHQMLIPVSIGDVLFGWYNATGAWSVCQ